MNKPKITQGDWCYVIDGEENRIESTNGKICHNLYKIADAEAILAIHDIIDALIQARNTLLYINNHDAYGDFEEEINEIEKALKKAGCTDESN